MRESLDSLMHLYKNSPNYLGVNDVEIDRSDLKQLIANIYSPGPSFQFVFQFKTRSFIYTSPSSKQLLGLGPQELDLNTYSQLIHPTDAVQMVHFEEVAHDFLYGFLKKDQIASYKVSYKIRIKTSSGYKLFLHQAVPLTFDGNYKLAASLVNQSDISHITATNNNKMSFINLFGGQSYFNIRKKEDFLNYGQRKIGYKPRELQILGLISEGMDSKEIAEYLNISIETVRTHRRNILARNDFNNISQAIAFYIREGLI